MQDAVTRARKIRAESQAIRKRTKAAIAHAERILALHPRVPRRMGAEKSIDRTNIRHEPPSVGIGECTH